VNIYLTSLIKYG